MSMERIKPTRSGLFAIELLIAVGVFSLCAAICVGLFVRSEIMSRDSADLSRAVNEARSAADSFKAAGGDMEKTAALTGGQVVENTVFISFDGDWNKLESGEDCVYEIALYVKPGEGCTGATLSVQRNDAAGNETTGTTILQWEVAALEVAA